MTFNHIPMLGGDGDGLIPSYYNRPSSFAPIDPSLEADTPSTGQRRGHYVVEQFLCSEQSIPLYPAPRPQESQCSVTESNVTPPPPFRWQGRHNSPFSQYHSSTASGIQSPCAESDLYYESTHGPSTPPDQAVVSPYLSSMPYDQWDHSSSDFSLTGINLAPPGGCVNPSVINSSQSVLVESQDSKPSMDFALCRDPSFDSTNSSQYQETAPYHPTSLHPESKQPFIKSEIQPEPAQAPFYPDPQSIDEDVKSPNDITVGPEPCDDEDEDYKPTTRRKPARNTRSKHRRTRSKPSSSSPQSNRVSKSSASPSDAGCRIASSFSGNLQSCTDCSGVFKDEAALQKHTKAQHTRPFTCVFVYAGCTSTFATKNEWKRHVSAQHLALYYYLCTHDACGQPGARQSPQSRSAVNAPGRPFRRKDLFTQHARRMHVPASARQSGKATGADTNDWDKELKVMQENAHRQRCCLPTYMRCPASGCSLEFHGEKAWDERMEHVARHLERAANGEEAKVQFGGPNDDTLLNWAAREDVGVVRLTPNGWKLGSPLKELKVEQNVMSSVFDQGTVDEDAEGEEDFH